MSTSADISVTQRGELLVAAVAGEVDMTNAAYVREELTSVVPNDARALVMDLTDAMYLDSAAIEVLFELSRRLSRRRQELRLVVPSDSPLQRLMEVIDVASVAPVYEDLEAAAGACRRRFIPCTGDRASASIAEVKKELRPFHDHVTCDVCGRTILKGERTEAYLVQGGERRMVCELCFVRAEHAGWIRESGADQTPIRPQRQQERRPLLGRLRRRQPDVLNGDEDTDSHDVVDDMSPPEEEAPPAEQAPERRRPAAPERAPRTHDPRHVRAVPSTAEAKVERALEVFNASGHQRTVSGLSRSLGPPFVSAHADAATPSIVNLVVAWELSWYRYRIDLGDASDPVSLAAKGDEMDDIDEALRAWNGALDAEDRLVIGVAQQ